MGTSTSCVWPTEAGNATPESMGLEVGPWSICLSRGLSNPTTKQWLAKLLGYDFEVHYNQGLENKAADALSRLPVEVHLAHLIAPTIIDMDLIKEEISKRSSWKPNWSGYTRMPIVLHVIACIKGT